MKRVNEEPLTTELQNCQPRLYSHVLNCYLQSASCYIHLQQYEEALHRCDTILAVEENSKALFLKGCIFEDINRPEEAIRLFQRALVSSPTDPYIMGRLRRLQTQ